jgi:hypothetical protein
LMRELPVLLGTQGRSQQWSTIGAHSLGDALRAARGRFRPRIHHIGFVLSRDQRRCHETPMKITASEGELDAWLRPTSVGRIGTRARSAAL